MKELNLIVVGKVQGVFFRKYTIDVAEEYGIFGRVKNTEDGNVEIVVQGEEKSLQKFKEKIKEGNFLSRVDDCIEEWQEANEVFIDFQKDD